ncbi:hypothetical protein HIM_01495 [Hirsutella minnesotensis 3608]|nr:hypothetical protein HIM_01495 [Hirsutella minnesotensis 3608]
MRLYAVLALFMSSGLATPILEALDPAVFQKISYYAAFPRLSLNLSNTACVKPSNGAQLIKFIQVPTTDTQVALWKDDTVKQVVIALPGTASFKDFMTDIDASQADFPGDSAPCPGRCKVHSGFLKAWQSIAPQVKETLTAALAGNEGYTTAISGHSLGGAIASLAYTSLKGGPFRMAEVYTYGQPRVGNAAFAKFVDGLSGATAQAPGAYFRVTHADDGVPNLPPRFMNYVHSRTEYWESASAADAPTTFMCSDVGQEASDCNLAASSLGINSAHSSYAGFNVTCD